MKWNLLLLAALLLAGCVPATAAAPAPSATYTPMQRPIATEIVAIATLRPPTATPAVTATPTHAAPTPIIDSVESATATTRPADSLTPTPAPTEDLVENLLDWQPVPNQGIGIRNLAFDGDWLVVEALGGIADTQNRLFARKMEAQFQEIFAFEEWKAVTMYEWGSGIEIAAGRVAFVVGPYQGDTTHGYEVWLADLERGEKIQVKASENAMPGIALSERWLAVLDSTSEQAEGGERCIEAYALPGLGRQQVFCTEDRITWPVLSGDWLTYKRYPAGKEWETNFPIIQTLNLVTGETYSTPTNTHAVSLKIYTSESLIAWLEDEQIAIWTRPNSSQDSQEIARFGSNWPQLQVCGERVYYTAEYQGAMELRSWQPDGTVRVLQRYRGLEQFDPLYKDLPQYDVWEIQCGSGWVLLRTNKGDLFLARDRE